jgi:mRNA-degrading endonuclease RelE of RelBE toxin-antitoxin system
MNWKIEIKPSAEKSYLKLDNKARQRIKKALCELESASDPFLHPNVRGLTPNKASMTLYVYAILPRKDAY